MLRKILVSILVLALLLVGAVVSIPFFFKDKLNAFIKEEINKSINAKVDYSDFSVSLFKGFPDFTLVIEGLSVVGINEFKSDTLLHAQEVDLTVDLKSVFKGSNYKLVAINAYRPNVNAKVNYLGKANWDIMKPGKNSSDGKSNAPYTVEVKKIYVEDARITYLNKKEHVTASFVNVDFTGSGDVSESIYDLITTTNIDSATFKSGAVAYLSTAKLHADITTTVDNINNKYTFKENTITINELPLHFDGWVQTKKAETAMDLKFKSTQAEFKNILSLVPAVYKKDFDKIRSSGSLALEGKAKGTLKDDNYPAFDLNLKVNNGMFQYPDLPVAVRNVFLTALVTKPQGILDAMTINVSKFHLEAGTDPVDGKVFVKNPISDPYVDAQIVGKMNLANVPKFYPIEGLKTLTGLLSLNLNFKGKQSDFDKKNFQAVSASGNARISNLVYDDKETPMPVKVMAMDMDFSPQQVDLKAFSSVIGRSDFNATGKLGNFMAYVFGKGELDGYLQLRSAQFDANEWLQKDKPTAGAKAGDNSNTQYFQVPQNINFTAQSTIGKLFYEKLVLQNVSGEIKVRNEAIFLNNLFANVLGGDATISAIYDTKDRDYPDVSFTYDINNFDFQQTYKLVGMAEKLAPVIKHVQGSFSSDLQGSGKLNRDMSVDYSSLTGDGKVEIPSAKIVGLPILEKVGEVSKIPALQNLQLTNAMTVLQFKDGKVKVDPTNLKFGNGYSMDVKGTNGFDKSIDYDFQFNIPSKSLGPATSMAQGYFSKIPGLGLTMPEIVSFVFKATGTADKPKVTLSKVLAGGSSVKDVLQSKTDDLKKQAEEEAKKQADAVKKQAEDAAAKAKADAEKRAKEAADKLKKEAENKLKDVFKFPK